ncbi:flagellar hook-associated protein FlgK [Rhizobium sp. SSA_523]|uniref:flagellar hook-associated protein FlgK n=1 Tax=Rhizobium sp. SSA_523 TaxID=2952477 RepID=UPI002091306C|nr:flagellar hook-associated protein FlgK [Rhizobium sp. SSA_523]MCO5733035.1 flagellar hook-associated protein FlgK [Rhizobium sp. SSA_523]WKC23915.1 flagellar hook-associated protein FlgK [Rhizobium sp. SSA_523]
MSLSSARSTAQAIFNNTARQSAVIGTNISNVQNPDYNKRTVMIVSTEDGARVGSVYREENAALFRQALDSLSDASGQQTLVEGLTSQIANLLGGNNYGLSPNTYLTKFYSALESYTAKPSDKTLASGAISAARDLTDSLNKTSKGLQDIRADADKKISEQVGNLNKLLERFEAKNNEVIQATATGRDANSAIDERASLLKKISEIVGVRTTIRENGDMALYTKDGTTLFETIPRKVSFTPTVTYDAATIGGKVQIEGVTLPPGKGGDTSASGSLQALLQIRDDIAPTFQRQMDEIANRLIDIFKETANPPSTDERMGLFVDSGSTTGTVGGIDNLAFRISINSAVTPPGGDPAKLRDGNINGAGYGSNTTNSSGYSDLLKKYADLFNDTGQRKAPATDRFPEFAAATEIGGFQTLLNFSTASTGWFETIRSSASKADETKTALMSRTSEAYSNTTGVSLDEELSLLLEVEQSYKAGTKLLNTVDEMIKTLLDSVG